MLMNPILFTALLHFLVSVLLSSMETYISLVKHLSFALDFVVCSVDLSSIIINYSPSYYT